MNSSDYQNGADDAGISDLLAAADRFEEAIKNSDPRKAFTTARKLEIALNRSFSNELRQILPSTEIEPKTPVPAFVTDPLAPGSSLDDDYKERVYISLVEFRETLKNRNVRKAIAALCTLGIIRRIPTEAEQLEKLEIKAATKTGSSRLPLLPLMAQLALNLGEGKKAVQYAEEALSLVETQATDLFGTREDAIYRVNTVLGLVALQRGATEQARNYLLASAATRGTPVLSTFGPNMVLASELLKQGERETVALYLTRCMHFWGGGRTRLEAWIEEIRKGGMPDFGPNLNL